MLRMAHWIILGLLLACSQPGVAGQNSTAKSGPESANSQEFLVWDEAAQVWLQPDLFWTQHIERSKATYWGRASAYPPYETVHEHDLIWIETAAGDCLMEFYHRRWRRANDVWRWDKRYSQYRGCATVHQYRDQLISAD